MGWRRPWGSQKVLQGCPLARMLVGKAQTYFVLAFDWSQSFDCKLVIQTGFLKIHQEFEPQLWQILVTGTQGNLELRETTAEALRNKLGTC